MHRKGIRQIKGKIREITYSICEIRNEEYTELQTRKEKENLEGSIREMYRMAQLGVACTEVNRELNRKTK